MKNIYYFYFIILMFLSTSCIKQDVIESNAEKKAKSIGIDITGLEKSKACKYFGLIGDNSVVKAKENSKIKFAIFNYTDGNFFKSCTYLYGQS